MVSPGSGWPRSRRVDAVTAVSAAVGWTLAGALGLGLTSRVLVLALSPVADQGANSAALQVCDGFGSVVCIGAAGAIFASLTRGTRPAPGPTWPSTRSWPCSPVGAAAPVGARWDTP